jgi:xanthine dehydrogenase accessory factor
MIRAVIAELAAAARAERQTVLATLVSAVGSTYRRPAARAALDATGHFVGLISGGCLEADLARHARDVLATGVPRLVAYDTQGADDLLFGSGGGCRGAVEIWLEPVPAHGRDPALVALLGALERGEAVHERLLLCGAHAGARLVIFADTRCVSPTMPETLLRRLETGAGSGGGDRVAYLQTPRRRHLLVCGAGADASPLITLTRVLELRLTVVDRRPVALERHGFEGDELGLASSPDAALVRQLRPDAAVIMTHNLAMDLGWARACVRAGVGYVGLLGPKARGDEIRAALTAAGLATTTVFGPTGLDLGGEGPGAIALSIVAELMAVLAGRSGRSLGAPPAEVRYVNAECV